MCTHIRLHGLAGAAALAAASAGGLGHSALLVSLGEKFLVRGSLGGGLGSGTLGGGGSSSLSLNDHGGNQSLNLGSLGDGLSGLVLELALDDVLSDVVGRGQVKELANLAGSLGSLSDGGLGRVVGKSNDGLGSDGGKGKVENGKIGSDDASSNGLSLALSLASGAVAGLFAIEKKSHSLVGKNSLFHRETLFVVSSGNTEDVSLEFLGDVVSADFLSHALVVESAKFLLFIDFDAELRSESGVGDVELYYYVGRDERVCV